MARDTARGTGGTQPSPTTVGVQGRAATPVVLVHGFAGSSTSWSAVRRALRAHGRTVVLCGYPPWASSVDDLAARLVETVEDVLVATGAGKVHLVGLCLGGVIIALALRATVSPRTSTWWPRSDLRSAARRGPAWALGVLSSGRCGRLADPASPRRRCRPGGGAGVRLVA